MKKAQKCQAIRWHPWQIASCSQKIDPSQNAAELSEFFIANIQSLVLVVLVYFVVLFRRFRVSRGLFSRYFRSFRVFRGPTPVNHRELSSSGGRCRILPQFTGHVAHVYKTCAAMRIKRKVFPG